MKRTPSSLPPHSTETQPDPPNDWTQDDPLWEILEQATEHKPCDFFARNVVRVTRQLKPPTLGSRVSTFFNSRRLALSAAACAALLITYAVWPTPENSPLNPTPVITQQDAPSEPNNDLSELVIEETLLAAADDPSIFTRDEVATMLGL